jgi:hypothetical protein
VAELGGRSGGGVEGWEEGEFDSYRKRRMEHSAPIRDVGIGSKVRHPDYLPNVA